MQPYVLSSEQQQLRCLEYQKIYSIVNKLKGEWIPPTPWHLGYFGCNFFVAWDTSTTSATKCVPTNILQLLKKSKLYSISINCMMQKNEGGGWQPPTTWQPEGFKCGAKKRAKVRTISLFTALHRMQTRSSDENSVCLSVTRVNCDKTAERSVQISIPYERAFILVF